MPLTRSISARFVVEGGLARESIIELHRLQGFQVEAQGLDALWQEIVWGNEWTKRG
jgi:hypothetical protein